VPFTEGAAPPAATTIAPTIRLSVAARAMYCGPPAAATRARAPTKIGVMVESAPNDIRRLDPKTRKAKVPAMKAKKPNSGGRAPSLAVAICSGMAIAARVTPAMRSGPTNAVWYPANDCSNGQRGSAAGACFACDAVDATPDPSPFRAEQASPYQDGFPGGA